MRHVPDASMDEFLATVAVTRLVMGPDVPVQAPPNLVSAAECAALIRAGIDDWGGVSPVTPDHVNPERPWPNLDTLAEITAAEGYLLVERTATHPKYVRAGQPWTDPAIAGHVAALTDPDTGLARTLVSGSVLPIGGDA
jgi:FO synthase